MYASLCHLVLIPRQDVWVLLHDRNHLGAQAVACNHSDVAHQSESSRLIMVQALVLDCR